MSNEQLVEKIMRMIEAKSIGKQIAPDELEFILKGKREIQAFIGENPDLNSTQRNLAREFASAFGDAIVAITTKMHGVGIDVEEIQRVIPVALEATRRTIAFADEVLTKYKDRHEQRIAERVANAANAAEAAAFSIRNPGRRFDPDKPVDPQTLN